MAFTQSETIVSQLFQSSMGRQVSSMAGLSGWVDRYDAKIVAGMSSSEAQQSVLSEMNTSPESQAIYSPLDDAGIVDYIFGNSLGRAAIEPGRTLWIERAARIPLEQLQQEILQAASQNDDFVYMQTLIDQAEEDLGGSAPDFILESDVDSAFEGADVTYTVTASVAVSEDTDVVFTVVPDDNEAANAGTSSTNAADFSAADLESVTVTILAGETTAVFSASALEDGIAELEEVYSVIAAVENVSPALSASVNIIDASNTVAITADTIGVDGVVENFTYAIDSSTGQVVSQLNDSFTLSNFTVDEDSLTFIDVIAGTTTTATFVDDVTTSGSIINNLTDIIFDANAEGDAFQLQLVGIVDAPLATVDMSVINA